VIFLGPLRTEVQAAPWFAALGAPLSEEIHAQARAYLGADGVLAVTSWRQAEDFLKSPDTSLDWWVREETLRKELLARAQQRYPRHVLWRSLTELTTETGDLVHARARAAAARLEGAAPASPHVAAGAASQAVYQLAVARIAGCTTSPFESKFQLFASGRWPLGIADSRLVLF
jgi:hypothetical protein